MEHEIWKHVVGYEGVYEVSNFGRVRSQRKILKQGINRKGYYYVNLCKDKVYKQYETHRIIAIAFIDNPQGKEQVDHIDAKKLNNKVSNLRWATPKENSNNINSLQKLRCVMKDKTFLKKRWEQRKEIGGRTAPKTIFMYTLGGEYVRCFDSLTAAAHFFNGSHATISVAVDSKTRTAYGYKWYSQKIEPAQ